MKELKSLVFLILLGLTIYLCFQNFSLRKEISKLESNLTAEVDTIYISKPFQKEKEYGSKVEPEKIIVYQAHPSNSVDSPSTAPLDSLVQFSLTRSLLKVTLAAPPTPTSATITLTKEFPIDLDRYKYRFDPATGNLTKKKASRFSVYPYVEYRIKPFNIFTDLSGGLQVKTKSFNYKLGISLSYYPTISKKLYKDLEFSFTYNF